MEQPPGRAYLSHLSYLSPIKMNLQALPGPGGYGREGSQGRGIHSPTLSGIAAPLVLTPAEFGLLGQSGSLSAFGLFV